MKSPHLPLLKKDLVFHPLSVELTVLEALTILQSPISVYYQLKALLFQCTQAYVHVAFILYTDVSVEFDPTEFVISEADSSVQLVVKASVPASFDYDVVITTSDITATGKACSLYFSFVFVLVSLFLSLTLSHSLSLLSVNYLYLFQLDMITLVDPSL